MGMKIAITDGDGTTMNGLFLGVAAMEEAAYREIYESAAAMLQPGERVPGIGERISLLLQNTTEPVQNIEFTGFDYTNFLVLRMDDQKSASIPWFRIREIHLSDGSLLNPVDLVMLVQANRAPVNSILRMSTSFGKTDIPMYQITRLVRRIPKQRAAITGFVIGAVIDAVVILALTTKKKPPPVTAGGYGGSCPYLYLEIESGEWVRTAELFSRAASPQLQAEDWISIPPDAVGDARRNVVLLTNELPETHFIDRVAWAMVDHAPGRRVVRDVSGRLWETGESIPLKDDAAPIVIENGWRIQVDLEVPTSRREQVLEITARNTAVAENALVDLAGMPWKGEHQWAGLSESGPEVMERLDEMLDRLAISVSLKMSREWVELERIPMTGPAVPRSVAVRIPAGGAGQSTYKVRLEWPRDGWELYEVRAAEVFGPAGIPRVVSPSRAYTEAGVSRLKSLQSVDGDYAVLSPGDTMSVVLPAADAIDPEGTTLFMIADGYYISFDDPSGWSTARRIAARALLDPAYARQYAMILSLYSGKDKRN
ncbi:hypothetical protein ACFL6R_02635 [Gemmatimonadota bacterium]